MSTLQSENSAPSSPGRMVMRTSPEIRHGVVLLSFRCRRRQAAHASEEATKGRGKAPLGFCSYSRQIQRFRSDMIRHLAFVCLFLQP